MKKFTKICLILAGCFFLLGMVFCVAGFAMGATLSDFSVWYDVNEKSIHTAGDGRTETEYEESFTGIEELSLEIDEADMSIVQGSGEEFVVRAANVGSGFSCRQEGSELKIKDTAHNIIGINLSGLKDASSIVLEVPEGTVLRKLDVEVGVGSLTAENIATRELEGECGVGSIMFDGHVERECQIECGVGNVNLVLSDSEDAFDYEMECGIGSIILGNNEFSGLGNEKRINNGANKVMKLECGVGEIAVSFQE